VRLKGLSRKKKKKKKKKTGVYCLPIWVTGSKTCSTLLSIGHSLNRQKWEKEWKAEAETIWPKKEETAFCCLFLLHQMKRGMAICRREKRCFIRKGKERGGIFSAVDGRSRKKGIRSSMSKRKGTSLFGVKRD